MPTIALVDDDRNILTSVSIALEAEGYRITTYTDGASALDGFKTALPDLEMCIRDSLSHVCPSLGNCPDFALSSHTSAPTWGLNVVGAGQV